MKIEIEVDGNGPELELTLRCRRLTPEIEKILAFLRMMDQKITVKKEGAVYQLDAEKVIYMESVDRKCFVYTADEMYESDLKLYEMEERLAEYGFFRVSKSCLLQLKNIQSLRADIDRRIRITMTNGEQIIASRQYADGLKKRLGVK